ncbi:hypothetical protein GCM10010124_13110 [Pilimelia terevasa]|uniref:DUF6545 domain-containing protein n=1 Tax=Pilimelia terevasa TaxID=53372 RepID=A0A8J3BNI2_9ACTN|nr:MAB_1171c family putative transporter [Pilimelia terevasa]GGK21992.1 hypothetical protein GCM10010124_13110 [Pilimelia terevasa]
MLTAKAVVFTAGLYVCLLVAGYLAVRRLRRGPDLALTTLTAAFLLKGLAFGLSTPGGSAAVDRATGVPNLGALGIHLAGGVLSTAALLVAVTYWTCPPDRAPARARGWVLALAVVGAAMVALWLVANLGATTRDRHYLLANAGRPVVAAYLLLYVGGIIVSMYAMARTTWRSARATAQPWLRRGLWTAAAGAATYVVFGLNRLSALLAAILGVDALGWEVVTVTCTFTGIVLLGLGLTMPHWGPSLSAAARAWGRRGHLRRLYPLWRDLHRRYPAIALTPHGPLRDVCDPRDLEFRRYRRVIEIRDGLLATGAAPTPADPPVAVAAGLRQLLLAPAPGARAPDPAGPPGPAAAGGPAGDTTADFDRELAWLLAVAHHYRRPAPPAPRSRPPVPRDRPTAPADPVPS